MDEIHEITKRRVWNECKRRTCSDCNVYATQKCVEKITPENIEAIYTLMFGEEATAKMLGGEK